MIRFHTQPLQHQHAHNTPWHQHPEAQLYVVEQGMILVETREQQWAVMPGTLGWFPPGTDHAARVPSSVKGMNFYLDGANFPATAAVFAANDFLRALLLRLASPAPAQPENYHSHLMTLLFDELALTPTLPLHLPLPTDRRLRNIADTLFNPEGCRLSQPELAQQWGISPRTLSRLFSQETGMRFSQWRQQSRLITSLSLLDKGLPVGEVAWRCGYDNTSAFIAAFRLRFGVTPGRMQERTFTDPPTRLSLAP
ncbi:AraC family transcriptional regulator [Enterobacter asburiae]|uniref:helix-turn-helix transcriptional regulator n=1 Tax=Scandinavium sp. UTDF21-P1B TaxID=3446379 RepID=UPI00348A3F79